MPTRVSVEKHVQSIRGCFQFLVPARRYIVRVATAAKAANFERLHAPAIFLQLQSKHALSPTELVRSTAREQQLHFTTAASKKAPTFPVSRQTLVLRKSRSRKTPEPRAQHRNAKS